MFHGGYCLLAPQEADCHLGRGLVHRAAMRTWLELGGARGGRDMPAALAEVWSESLQGSGQRHPGKLV